MPIYDSQQKKQFRSISHKQPSSDTSETFHVMHGKPTEKRVVKYTGADYEILMEQYERDQRDLELEQHARRTFHKEKRSTSRASNSSRKAGVEIQTQQIWIEENRHNIEAYKEGHAAISAAALALNNGKELTGEGVDFVRTQIKEALKSNPSLFSAQRGAKNAAKHISTNFNVTAL